MLDELDVEYGFETVPVKVTTETIDDNLMVSLTSYDSSIAISYFDGSEHFEYDKPLIIDSPVKWAITFTKGATVFNDTIYQRFEPHKANGLTPDIVAAFNSNYTAGGVDGITNGAKGSNQFRDGNWQGYWGDDVIATIDLGESKPIKRLSSGFLQYNNAWIFFPTEVMYEVSENGTDFTLVGKVVNKESPRDKRQKTHEFTLMLPNEMNVRYVRMSAKKSRYLPRLA